MSDDDILALEAVDGATVALERFPIVVGRLVAGDPVPDVDVGHLDPLERVAPAHCRLTLEEGGVMVHDLGSPAGTWVAGTRVRPGHPRRLDLHDTLRIADVRLTLVALTPSDPAVLAAPPSGVEPTPLPGVPVALPPPRMDPPARPPGAASRPPVPPPPSLAGMPTAMPAEAPADAPAEAAAGDPLQGGPAEVRSRLGTGATAVRLHAGSPALVRRGERWAEEGPILTVAAVETAIAEARRILGIRDGRPAGVGRGAGLLLDWVAPPLSRSAHLAAEPFRREPADLPPPLRRALAAHLGHGRPLLVVAPWPAPILAALAEGALLSLRPRAVPAEADAWWVPAGWPLFSAVPELPDDIDALLAGGLTIVEGPTAPELERLMARSPHGALVVSVEGPTVLAGLERVRLALGRRREQGQRSPSASDRERAGLAGVVGAFPTVLAPVGSGLQLLRVDAGEGRWQLDPVALGDPL